MAEDEDNTKPVLRTDFTAAVDEPAAAPSPVGLSDALIAEVVELVDEGYTDRIHEICGDLSAVDTAELLEKVDHNHRLELIDILGEEINSETYLHLNRNILEDILELLPAQQIAFIVNELDSDDALELIETVEEERRGEVLKSLSRKIRAAVEEGLTFPKYSAGRLMQREFVAIPLFWTVGKTVDYLRAAANSLPETFYDIFIVDPLHKYVGNIPLNRILRSPRSMKAESLMDKDKNVIDVEMDQEDVARLFRREDLVSAPVTDDNGRLVGMITIDDIVDVIDEEAEDDVLKLGGVADTDLHRSTLETTRARFTWLFVNLFTAIAASIVIGLFEETLNQLVALAVLMPIVASMGGNAGTQSMTIAVRAIATRELSAANAWRIMGKELVVGILNGFVFALLMGIIAAFWFDMPMLGAVIGMAMVINLTVAGLSGIALPMIISKLGLDPALSSGVFLTTVTDVVGFFAFLGLAGIFLL